jgi:predicted outer membrane repeat protein
LILVDSTFVANTTGVDGGAIYTTGSSMTLANRAFFGNKAVGYGGAVMGDNSTVDLVNCLFDGNRVEGTAAYKQAGGALANQFSTLTATNCTFANNTAVRNASYPTSGVGGGFYHGIWAQTVSNITNCVFWGNSDGDGTDESAQIFVDSQSYVPPVVTHTLIHGLIPGGDFDNGANLNNLGDNPLFDDDLGSDGVIGTEDDSLRLRFGSPCVNAGDNTALPPDTLDIDGNGNFAEPLPFDLDGWARVDGCVVDMGAYELMGSPPGAILGDFDGDCDVDLQDHAFLEYCISSYGPHVPPVGCEDADLDSDAHVSLSDFGVFQHCFSGDGIPADPNCAR